MINKIIRIAYYMFGAGGSTDCEKTRVELHFPRLAKQKYAIIMVIGAAASLGAFEALAVSSY
jgi:hypothetical protein